MAGGPAHVGRAHRVSVPSSSRRKHENHEPPRAREGRGLRGAGLGGDVSAPPPGGFPPPARGVPAESSEEGLVCASRPEADCERQVSMGSPAGGLGAGSRVRVPPAPPRREGP